tara:strand:+ start:120 stop:1523 length:1404 start_codon:yes stop_codon:yes gene_type:complete
MTMGTMVWDMATGTWKKDLLTLEKDREALEEKARRSKLLLAVESAGSQLARDPYRQKVEQDLLELRGLKETGGPAAAEARKIQKGQAAAQTALARGLGRSGGAGLRRGTEAAAESYVQSKQAVALATEAAKQGYTKQEAAMAGLLAMSDAEFRQKIDQVITEKARADIKELQQEEASSVGAVAQAASIGASIYGAKEGGIVPGKGTEDTVPAMLTPGEIVIPKELSAQLMAVMRRRVDNGPISNARAGGMIMRNPDSGYLESDSTADELMRLQALRNRWPATVEPAAVEPVLAPPYGPQLPHQIPRSLQGAALAPPYAPGPVSRERQLAPPYTPIAPRMGPPPSIDPRTGPPRPRLTIEQIRGMGLPPKRREAPRQPIFSNLSNREWLKRYAPEALEDPKPAPVTKPKRKLKSVDRYTAQEKTAMQKVLSKFKGSSKAYDEWFGKLKGKKPRNWGQALDILEKQKSK